MILVPSRRPIPHPIYQPHVQRVRGGQWGRVLVLVLISANTSALVLVYGLGVVQLGWVGAQALNLMCRGPSVGSGVGNLEQGISVRFVPRQLHLCLPIRTPLH